MLQNNLTVAAAQSVNTTGTASSSSSAAAAANATSAIVAAAALQPKIVVIRRRPNQGYGFTLRHFIAYPPEDDDDDHHDDDDNRDGVGDHVNNNDDVATWPQEAVASVTTTSTSCSIITNDQAVATTTKLAVKKKKQQVKAMETIFIKEVHPNGPAHYANLQTGDRVLMVNNQPIAGIAYSTIVSMIKQTPSVLTLHVVPKECDVLQMHYTSIAHTPESNRSSGTAATMAGFQQTAAHLVGGVGAIGYGNSPTTKTTALSAGSTNAAPGKSFTSQHQQQQLISYQQASNNRLIGGANNLRSIEYNDALHQQHIHHQQQQQQQHYQHQQQHNALMLRGESGFTLR